MSTRERWIVYPLLFLTLGIALRDKVIRPVRLGDPILRIKAGELDSTRIRCREFIVEGQNGRPVVVATASPENRAGAIETFSADGAAKTRMFSNEFGGAVGVVGYGGKMQVAMGYSGENFGVFAEFPNTDKAIRLTLPLRIGGKEQQPQSPEDAADAAETTPNEETQETDAPQDAPEQ